MRRRVLLVLAPLLVVPAWAQEPAPPLELQRGRPKIGLALEGGGAHGLAHIGVLEWLEQNHIPVDYVAGTSMGGLVGGLYASGKSPAELRALIQGIDWDFVLSGAIPYRNLTFRRREDLRAYPNSILIGLRGGIRLPPGLNAGQQITLLVDRETLAYSEIESFDDLPVPFRCVATDLVTGQPKVFGDGPLTEALRATMSLPGLFTPVRSGGHIFIDGGIVDNLPSEVVRKMGADVVIAVHLRQKEIEASHIQSMFSVLGRTMDVAVAASEAKGLAAADLVVAVDVTRISATAYGQAATIVAKGLEAAAEQAPLLRPHALEDAAWLAHTRARDARRRHVAPVPQFVRVEGTSADASRHLERFLAPFVGKPIDGKRLDRDLTRLTGIGKFSRVGYRIITQQGREGLLVTLEENGYAPPMLQLAFEVDGSDAGNVGFTLATRLTIMDLGGYRSEWRTDVLFGSVYGIESEYFRPVTASTKWFVAPHAGASRSSFEVYQKDVPSAEYRLDSATVGVDVGYGFSRFAQVRLGYERGHLSSKLRIGNPELAEVDGSVGATRFRFVYDETDDPVIPRRGATVETAFSWYDRSPGAGGSFPSGAIRASVFQPITRRASLFLVAQGGTTFGEEDTGLPQFSLGGPQRLAAYGLNELRGNQYLLLSGGYLRDLWRLPPFVGKKVYAFGELEVGRMYPGPSPSGLESGSVSHWPYDAAVGLVAQTALGPLFVGGSVGDNGHRRWFFKLGRFF